MPISAAMSFLVILTVALTTFATRVVPFLIFPKGERDSGRDPVPGKGTDPAVIGMLVVYCLKATPVLDAPHGLPEAIAVAITAGLHVWKRNNLLSIGAGTILYMVLIQAVF